MTDPNRKNSTFTFHSFADISIADWLLLLNHPDVICHMPLTDGKWTEASVLSWVAGKDQQWAINGYGPWAIALVLLPNFWGHGASLVRAMLDRRVELNIDAVSVLLPSSRLRFKGLIRLGFVPDGELEYEGHRFMKFTMGENSG